MKTPASIKKEMGQRLKKAREDAGYLTPEEFCSKNNLPLELYLQHEKGTKGIKASNAKQYCKLLSISLDMLIIGEEIAMATSVEMVN